MDPVTVMTSAKVGVEVVSTASKVMVDSIKALYGTARSINDFLNEHIEEMKGSENHTASRTGKVLEEAKIGFGIGFITPVIVIATGQLILGNPLTAVTVVVTAPINPIAMTCAAVGAIYYGWSVLTEQEKKEIIERLSQGLEIGIEMIKSVIRFITEKVTVFLSPENLDEIKKYIRETAELFGRTLSDVTHRLVDILSDTGDVIKTVAVNVIDRTGGALSNTFKEIVEQGGKVFEKMTPGKVENIEKVAKEPIVVNENITPAEMKMKLGSNGQLTIPLELLEQLGLSPDSKVELVIEGGNVTLRKAES